MEVFSLGAWVLSGSIDGCGDIEDDNESLKSYPASPACQRMRTSTSGQGVDLQELDYEYITLFWVLRVNSQILTNQNLR